jgi:SAM-dependent methyltransferase
MSVSDVATRVARLPVRATKAAIHHLGRAYIRTVVRREAATFSMPHVNERPIEYAFVFRWLNDLQPVSVLDVGSGTSPLPAALALCGFRVTAIDNVRDYWPEGMLNRHWHVVDDDIRATGLRDHYDVITCISTLEHISEAGQAMASMLRLVRPGGHILLTCPYNETRAESNVYHLPGSYGVNNPYICQQFSRKQLESWLAGGAAIVDRELWRCFEDSDVWSCGRLLRPPERVRPDQSHQLMCAVIRRKE